MDAPEQLANELTLADIELRLRILNEVIQYDQTRGGEQWKVTAAPQADLLNAARAILLKRCREERDEPDPVPVVVKAVCASAGAKGRSSV